MAQDSSLGLKEALLSPTVTSSLFLFFLIEQLHCLLCMYCCAERSSLMIKAERSENCTFNSPPLGLPPQQPPAIDLVLLVAAHHSKGDHLLLPSQKVNTAELETTHVQ